MSDCYSFDQKFDEKIENKVWKVVNSIKIQGKNQDSSECLKEEKVKSYELDQIENKITESYQKYTENGKNLFNYSEKFTKNLFSIEKRKEERN